MNKYKVLVGGVLIWLLSLTVGCGGQPATKPQEITFDQLFASPDKYSGKYVTIEGFYFQGWEVVVLSEKLDFSGGAPGHLVPKGRIVWVAGSITKDVYDQLYEQQMTGPTERYGKISLTGKFDYGGKYGHVGGYNSQIVPSEVKLLPWSPPKQ